MLNKGCVVEVSILDQTTCTLKEAKPWIDGTIARPCFVVVLSLVIPWYTVSSTFDHAWPQGSGFLMVIPHGIQRNTLFWQSKKHVVLKFEWKMEHVFCFLLVCKVLIHIHTTANHCMEFPNRIRYLQLSPYMNPVFVLPFILFPRLHEFTVILFCVQCAASQHANMAQWYTFHKYRCILYVSNVYLIHESWWIYIIYRWYISWCSKVAGRDALVKRGRIPALPARRSSASNESSD